MGKNQQLIKLFVVLLFCTAFIFSSSHFGAKAFESLTNADRNFFDGTSIGLLNISGKTTDEARGLLEEKFPEWIKEAKIELQFGEKIAPFDLNDFHLDAQQTVASIKNGQKNTAFITIDKSQVSAQLEILFPNLKTSDIDMDKLTTSLNATASLFEIKAQTFNLYSDYLAFDKIKKDADLNKVTVQLKEIPDNLESIIQENPKIDIPEESTFSLLEYAKNHKITQADALNVMATGIYEAIMPTNFSIIERNIENELPDYAHLGFEAKINQSKNTDLIIANPNKAKYSLHLTLDNNQLNVILKGGKFFYNYEISLQNNQTLAPKKIIQYSPQLLPGKINIQTKGKDGQIVQVYRDVYQDNEIIKSELISEDYYPAVYQVEIHGLGVSKQSTSSPTTQTTGNQSNDQTTTTTNQNSNTTTSPSETEQQDTDNSDLWGKPNEQPK
ncbi:G5 domain-containing protein [Neobacillus mesonae]|uniref:G5 domain-containing protein n=1 Tax=Neobacillus mesonae TaxID=1193713 RepID=UPI002E20E89D|nr:G5 domain-containing protein [Neobacillus mesonae]